MSEQPTSAPMNPEGGSIHSGGTRALGPASSGGASLSGSGIGSKKLISVSLVLLDECEPASSSHFPAPRRWSPPVIDTPHLNVSMSATPVDLIREYPVPDSYSGSASVIQSLTPVSY